MKTVLLTAVAAAGLTGLGLAAAPAIHEMTVAIPGGGEAHIRYTGDTPPKVNFVRSSEAMPVGFFAPSPFEEMERVSAIMDRQMATMMYQAHVMQEQAESSLSGSPLSSAEFNGLPSGSSYSFVSTMSGNGVCVKSMQVTSNGNGEPKVVSHTSGNCGPQSNTAAPAHAKTTSTPSSPLQTISFKPEAPVQKRQGV